MVTTVEIEIDIEILKKSMKELKMKIRQKTK